MDDHANELSDPAMHTLLAGSAATALSAPAAAPGVAGAASIRPFHVNIPKPRSSTCAAASPRRGFRRRRPSPTSRRACRSRPSSRSCATGATATTGGRSRRASTATAVHHRDRRARHPLPPRPLQARGRPAAHRDARLAGFDGRAAEDHRAAHQSRPRTAARRPTPSTSSSRRCPATASRASRPASAGVRSGSPAPGPRSCGAWATRSSRRRAATGARSSPRCWACRRRRSWSASTSTCRVRFRRRSTPRLFAGAPAPAGLSAEEQASYDQLVHLLQERLLRLLDGDAAADPGGARGLPDGPGDLHARPRRPQPRADRPIVRRPDGRPVAGRRSRQRHAVLADQHRRLGGPALLGEQARLLQPKGVKVPVAVSVFPDELYPMPRSWAEKAYPKLIYYNKLAKGGHFAAWEQPEALVHDVRAGLRSLRTGRPATALDS